jgi:hypothetical protein
VAHPHIPNDRSGLTERQIYRRMGEYGSSASSIRLLVKPASSQEISCGDHPRHGITHTKNRACTAPAAISIAILSDSRAHHSR